MPLVRRPRANSLQLIRITTAWVPPLPPTPRRATYSQPGTTSHSMAGADNAVIDSDAPPVPPISYWEPDTPSPVSQSPMSPYNPFLSPPPGSPASQKVVASPLLPASPLSMFDRQGSPKSSAYLLPRSADLSPRFMNPRTPPLPPTKKPITDFKQWEIRCSVLCGEPEKIQYQSVHEILVAAQAEVLHDMKTRKEAGMTGQDSGLVQYCTKVKKRKERRHIVKTKSFQVLKQVHVPV